MNWPRPSNSATKPPYTRVGRSSGSVTRKNTPTAEDPLTCAASINSELMLAKPELTKR